MAEGRDPSKLTITNDHFKVCQVLKTLKRQDLIQLGGALGLPYQEISSNCYNLPDDMVADWLNRKHKVLEKGGEPTWSSLANALEIIGHEGIAKDIRSREGIITCGSVTGSQQEGNGQHSTNDVTAIALPVSVLPTDSGARVQSQIDKFKSRFASLQLAARRELELQQNAVEIIKDELTVLPSEVMREHYELVTSIAMGVWSFPNLTMLFINLNLYCWNFFEYKLLKTLIERNCGQLLKAEMVKYEYDIQTFQSKTTVSDLIKCARHQILTNEKRDQSIPPHFKLLILEKGVDPDTYTLADLDRFRMDTCSNLTLSEWALQVYLMKHNCIIVEWMFPEELTEMLSCFYSDENGQELLRNHHVENISIDEQPLHSWVLLAAVKNGDRDKALSILQDKDPDINLNCQDWVNDSTPLFFAAKQGDVEIVTLLSDQGAELNITDNEGKTSLMIAVKAGQREVVEIFLEPGRDCQINVQEKVKGWSALHFAAYIGHVEIVKMIINPVIKANLLLVDHDGKTALDLAQGHGHKEVVDLLQPTQDHDSLDHDKQETQGGFLKGIRKLIPRLPRPGPKNKLVAAAKSGSVEEVQALLSEGIDSNTPDKRFHWSPLMHACHNGHIEVADILLSKGADPNWRGAQGWNALILASQLGFDNIVELLLTKGRCNPNIQTTTTKWTALHGLCRYISSSPNAYAREKCSDKYVRLVKVLLEHGAILTKTDKDDWTPLMIASRNGLLEIVNILIGEIQKFSDAEKKQNALDYRRKKDSRNALMEACSKGNTEVVQALANAGASLTLKRADGATAALIALKAGHDDVVDVLCFEALKRRQNLNIADKRGMTPEKWAKKQKKDKVAQRIQRIEQIVTSS